MTETQRKFLQMSEIYTTQDPNSKDHITKIMLAKGIVIQMEGDLILFEKSKGKTEKSIEQQERIDLLKSAIDTFYVISGKHLEIGYILHQYNELIKSYERKLDQYDELVVNLNKQLEFGK